MFDQSGGGDVNRSPPTTKPFLVMLPTWRQGKKLGEEGVVRVGGKYSIALLGVINETGWRRQGGSSDRSQGGDTDTIEITRLSSNHTYSTSPLPARHSANKWPYPGCRSYTGGTHTSLSYTGGTHLGQTLGAHVLALH